MGRARRQPRPTSPPGGRTRRPDTAVRVLPLSAGATRLVPTRASLSAPERTAFQKALRGTGFRSSYHRAQSAHACRPQPWAAWTGHRRSSSHQAPPACPTARALTTTRRSLPGVPSLDRRGGRLPLRARWPSGAGTLPDILTVSASPRPAACSRAFRHLLENCFPLPFPALTPGYFPGILQRSQGWIFSPTLEQLSFFTLSGPAFHKEDSGTSILVEAVFSIPVYALAPGMYIGPRNRTAKKGGIEIRVSSPSAPPIFTDSQQAKEAHD